MLIKPFSISTIKIILGEHGINAPKAIFDCYVITGGMPKYLDLFVTNCALELDDMLNFILQADSPFLNEGRNLLIEEFGRDYGTYFSILELIARGKTSRAEMQSILGSDVGGYLDRLENHFGLIIRHKPINAKPNARFQKYRILDNFLSFWFRFIHHNRSAVEAGNFGYIREVINRDYSIHCGGILEKCFKEIFSGTGKYNRIGSYWERGNQNEIDLVAINDLKKTIDIADVKLNKAKLNMSDLKCRAEKLVKSYPHYQLKWLGLSVDSLLDYIDQ